MTAKEMEKRFNSRKPQKTHNPQVEAIRFLIDNRITGMLGSIENYLAALVALALIGAMYVLFSAIWRMF